MAPGSVSTVAATPMRRLSARSSYSSLAPSQAGRVENGLSGWNFGAANTRWATASNLRGVSRQAGRFNQFVEGLGALRERPYRLLFAATVTTSLGDAIGTIAVTFAVLDVAGAISLGIVIAARQIASAGVLVFGGVLSDRARRNLVLAGASIVQGAAQGALAVAVLVGSATVPLFVALGALWGPWRRVDRSR